MYNEAYLLPVIICLHRIQAKHGKKYCFPSQLTILKLLLRHQHIKISLRTLNRWLRWLEDGGYFVRKRRITAQKNGVHHFKSTLYKLKKKAYTAMWILTKWISGFPVLQGGAKDSGKVAQGIIKGGSDWMSEERPMKIEDLKTEIKKLMAKLEKTRQGR